MPPSILREEAVPESGSFGGTPRNSPRVSRAGSMRLSPQASFSRQASGSSSGSTRIRPRLHTGLSRMQSFKPNRAKAEANAASLTSEKWAGVLGLSYSDIVEARLEDRKKKFFEDFYGAEAEGLVLRSALFFQMMKLLGPSAPCPEGMAALRTAEKSEEEERILSGGEPLWLVVDSVMHSATYNVGRSHSSTPSKKSAKLATADKSKEALGGGLGYGSLRPLLDGVTACETKLLIFIVTNGPLASAVRKLELADLNDDTQFGSVSHAFAVGVRVGASAVRELELTDQNDDTQFGSVSHAFAVGVRVGALARASAVRELELADLNDDTQFGSVSHAFAVGVRVGALTRASAVRELDLINLNDDTQFGSVSHAFAVDVRVGALTRASAVRELELTDLNDDTQFRSVSHAFAVGVRVGALTRASAVRELEHCKGGLSRPAAPRLVGVSVQESDSYLDLGSSEEDYDIDEEDDEEDNIHVTEEVPEEEEEVAEEVQAEEEKLNKEKPEAVEVTPSKEEAERKLARKARRASLETAAISPSARRNGTGQLGSTMESAVISLNLPSIARGISEDPKKPGVELRSFRSFSDYKRRQELLVDLPSATPRAQMTSLPTQMGTSRMKLTYSATEAETVGGSGHRSSKPGTPRRVGRQGLSLNRLPGPESAQKNSTSGYPEPKGASQSSKVKLQAATAAAAKAEPLEVVKYLGSLPQREWSTAMCELLKSREWRTQQHGVLVNRPHSPLSSSRAEAQLPPQMQFHRPWSREGGADKFSGKDDGYMSPVHRYAKVCLVSGVQPQTASVRFLASLPPSLDIRGAGYSDEDLLALSAALPFDGGLEALDMGQNPRVTDISACSFLRTLTSREPTDVQGSDSSMLVVLMIAAIASFLKKWDVLGPFVRGKTEQDGDPLEAFGGVAALPRGGPERFLSELVPGGYVGWQKVSAKKDGSVTLHADGHDFNQLVQSLSSLDVLNVQSWVVGDLKVTEEGVYMISCQQVHTLEAGRHTVRIKMTGKAPLQFRCQALPAQETLALLPPKALPQLHRGAVLGTALIGPMLRNSFSKWLPIRELEFMVEGVRAASGFRARVAVAVSQPHLPASIAPYLALLLPLVLEVELERTSGSAEDDYPDGDCVFFDLNVRWNAASTGKGPAAVAPLPLALRCRQRLSSFLFTFLDDDGSVSHAAAIEPFCSSSRAGCPSAPLPIVLSLSGVGVDPLSQADSHKWKPADANSDSEPFIFGFKDAWVLAPERGGPHNWEDWGPRTALRSVAALRQATEGTAVAADASRLLVAGHSRGGHGAWNLAERIPDRVLAVAPQSSWHSREQYSDANVIFSQDTSLLNLDPGLKAILERAIIENDSAMLAANLKGMPVLARHGGADRTVPTYHGRRMARAALEAGAALSYVELPGKEHWWWDSRRPNDGGAMHDAEMRNFSEHHLARRVGEAGCCEPPEVFEAVAFSPSSFHGRGGLRLVQTEVPFRRASVRASRATGGSGSKVGRSGKAEKWQLRTVNIRRLAMTPPASLAASMQIDGQALKEVELARLAAGSHLCLQAASSSLRRTWQLCSQGPDDFEATERGPSTWGPARQVVQSRPFAIVACTGAAAEAEAVEDLARYMAHGHLLAVGSRAPVIRPQDISEELRQTHNLVLVGLPEGLQNASSLLRGMADRWPVRFLPPESCGSDDSTCQTDDKDMPEPAAAARISIELGPCIFTASRVGVAFTAPRWEAGAGLGGRAHQDLVVSGTDIAGLRDLVSFDFATNTPHTRAPFTNMAPDFLVSGPEFKAKGYGGLLAAGFWGSNWEWRADTKTIYALRLDQCSRLGGETIMLCTKLLRACLLELQSLDLSGIAIGSTEYPALASAIESHPRLRDIRLADTGLGFSNAAMAAQVVASLVSNVNIESMELGWNCLDSACFETLGRGVTESTHLNHLGVASTAPRSGPGGMSPVLGFLELLAGDKSLTSLDISNNSLDSTAALMLEYALKFHPKIMYLDISKNPLGLQGMRPLLRLFASNGCPELARIVTEECTDMGEQTDSSLGLFDNDPSGRYRLDMSDPCHRTLFRLLLNRLVLELPFKAPVSTFVRGATLFSTDKEMPYSVDTIKSKKGNWQVPTSGHLCFELDYQDLLFHGEQDPECPATLVVDRMVRKIKLSVTKMRKVLALLCHVKSASVYGADDLLQALSQDFLLDSDQANALCKTGCTQVNCATDSTKAVLKLLPCLVGPLQIRKAVQGTVSLGDLLRVEQVGQALMSLNLENPTGRYRLLLSETVTRFAAQQLMLLNRWQAHIWKSAGTIDISKYGTGKCFRNEMLNTRPFTLPAEEWTLPNNGLFDFDFVSLHRPPKGAEPLAQEVWGTVLGFVRDALGAVKGPGRGKQKLSSEHVLWALRGFSSRIWILSSQLRNLLCAFANAEDRQDVFAMFFLRCVDWPINGKLCYSKFDEQQFSSLRTRLGYLNLFPFFQPEQTSHELNLTEYEQRRTLHVLVKLANTEHISNIKKPRIDLTGSGVYEGLELGIPISWDAYDAIAPEGILTASYACSMGNVRFKMRRRLAVTHGGWHCLSEDVAILAKSVQFWVYLPNVPSEAIRVLIFLMRYFGTLEQAFLWCDSSKGAKLNRQEFVARLLKAMQLEASGHVFGLKAAPATAMTSANKRGKLGAPAGANSTDNMFLNSGAGAPISARQVSAESRQSPTEENDSSAVGAHDEKKEMISSVYRPPAEFTGPLIGDARDI
ncbi:unnamed protein product [Polarella glacialis]|uniref:Protein NLRC3 n=1 Tax=Polarella glacialis TaxID=89957 RepID=A0A813K5L4_POLGL|nr:unnamed protein product [Polarella glacialis]